MTGVRDGALVHWSDMLAVGPEARDRGIGRRLKLYQRSLVAELGVTQILWTFDPLVARNAHLNLNALGARVIDYVPDMYGADTGSTLHQGIGTDRFVVAWEVRDRGAGDRRGGGAPSARGQARGGGDGSAASGQQRDGGSGGDSARYTGADRAGPASRPAVAGDDATGIPPPAGATDTVSAGFERLPAGGFYRLTRDSD